MLINNTSALVQNIKDRKLTSVVITTHHKPDGDAMGSTLGLCAFLKHFVTDVVVCTPTDYSENLFWLPGNADVLDFEAVPDLVAQKVAQAMLFFVWISIDFRESISWVIWCVNQRRLK